MIIRVSNQSTITLSFQNINTSGNIYKLDERKTTYSEYGQKDIGVARFHVFKKNRLELRIEVRVASGQLQKGKGKGIEMDWN